MTTLTFRLFAVLQYGSWNRIGLPVKVVQMLSRYVAASCAFERKLLLLGQ